MVYQRYLWAICHNQNSGIHHLSLIPEHFRTGLGLLIPVPDWFPAATVLFIPVPDWPDAGQPGIGSLDLTLSKLSPFYKCVVLPEDAEMGAEGELMVTLYRLTDDGVGNPPKYWPRDWQAGDYLYTSSTKFTECRNEEYIFWTWFYRLLALNLIYIV